MKFKSSTVGLVAFHDALKTPKLIRVEFYESEDGTKVTLKTVAGRNLARIKDIKDVTISRDDFANRPADPYNDVVEAKWAFGLVGAYFDREDEE